MCGTGEDDASGAVTISTGEMGVLGDSDRSELRRMEVAEGSTARAARAGESGAETSDSLRGLRRIPPLGTESRDEYAGLVGMSSDGPKVGEMPSEAMGVVDWV
jgi:hypothetical protein